MLSREASPAALPHDRVGAEGGVGELVDAPVQAKSADGVRIGPVCEVEYAGGVRQVETDGEAGQVGQRVAEGGEFPVQQQWLAASGADEVARLEVVVQQLEFRVRVRGVEFAAEGCCGRGEVGGGGCVGVEPVMQVVAPVAVARGSGEPSGVRAWSG